MDKYQISFWKQDQEGGHWDRVDVSPPYFFKNGTATEPFDFEKEYDNAFAVCRPWVIGEERAILKPRQPLRAVLAKLGIELPPRT